ncbi:hypothetical protein N0V84_003275 [Fusarium piperis]|uniref:Uncharacterized protein n=1 Tax=Fusarium piperis TaxID=1435070 RepID=A0A9W9BSB6_9HYPO|nr:hypothetical protein N0V84_003275 [Fusarium piperis]
MSSTCSLKLYMPIKSHADPHPVNRQLVNLSIKSLDKWQQNIAQHCPFASPWSGSNSSSYEYGPGDAGAEAGKRRVPEPHMATTQAMHLYSETWRR